MRERLDGDPAFTAVTVEAERIRIFNEHIATLEVCILLNCRESAASAKVWEIAECRGQTARNFSL